MILTLTLNPAIDLTYSLPALTPGASHRVSEPLQRAGGKGVNVARVLVEQGHRSMVMAPVGGPTGAQFRDDLHDSGLPHRLIDVAAPTRRTVTLVTEEHATALNEAGTAPSATELEDVLAALATELGRASVLVCSGSLPAGSPADLIARIVALARDAGVPVIVDTSGPPLLAAADAGADVLKPNQDELAQVAGSTADAAPADADPLDAALPAARTLATRSGGLVFASLGAAGMVALGTSGPAWHARLPEPLRGNPTGAGDAAVAAISLALSRHGRDLLTAGGDPLRDALRSATAWSAAAVLTPNAGSIADPAPLLDQVIVTQVLP